jgi:RNA polymerase sigma-70 factor (ECF subfamily)
MQQLDDEDRDILALIVSSGLTYREIAEIRGCSESAVKVRVHRARQQLRKILATEGS